MNAKLLKCVIVAVLFITSLSSSAYAYTEKDAESVPTGEVVYQSELGNKVVKIQKTEDDVESYVVVSKPIIYNEITEELKKKMIGSKEKVKIQRVYFENADSIEQAKRIAATPSPELTKGASGIQALSKVSFWHGSFIEEVWSWWWGDGWDIHISSTDVNYITNLSWVGADSLAAYLAATGVISNPAAVVVGGILTVAILTLSWSLQNNDGSIDITVYEPNINMANGVCVQASQWLGQATGLTGFLNYFWPSNAPGFCN
ncbi:hypothetical protein K0T92_12685 [Paenibacillus oenotherae]|uniref:Uncharacterized protein n=1 Tax=Paenibacillus oenotherae TaxID=1435645 RepID=A0ABS7D6V2_9BACL|nr:hypothetical protein [Paenibacillus oenotherae]MBW7475606.1 hypothetical protein [Paenibacillus oenotherae]